jgi:serine phosphatase RsbU (regulator of sigma subunit)
MPVEAGMTLVMYTDGLVHAGERSGHQMDVCETLQALLEDEDPSPQAIADSLLNTAMRLDDNRPSDDISVVALKTTSADSDGVRRMTVSLPFSPGD